MIRLYLHLILSSLFAFTLALLLIHAQPYDDAELRLFLTPPEGCPAPCFMGIQPGITAVREGSARLQSSSKIQSLRTVSFQWYNVQFTEDAAPIREARLYLLATPDVLVERVNLFDTGLPLSRFFLAFGRPEQITIHKTFRYHIITFVMFYPQYALYVLVDLPLCSINQHLLWDGRRDVSLGIGGWRGAAEQPDYYLDATDLDVAHWAQQLRDMKRELCP